uniref:Protocadherin domain-containing protein n=1 Tax=Salarias fasciatus TaxID=181472 RepID=A0A672I3B5_SALFA
MMFRCGSHPLCHLLQRHQSSPDLARHYKSSSPLPAVNLQPHSPPAEGKKHQAVQELPPSNTFVGSDAMSLGSDQCSEYGCQTGNKYSKQVGGLNVLSPPPYTHPHTHTHTHKLTGRHKQHLSF